ncbi:succinylglutamate desuccinylase [Undibacterium sp.]|jgi:succinylglutamate desuccinylase|uniref:succinylglutamate desuccinylase n=1 Tax=Undibacterium sp. TaxID=1914977 RepID=UPI002C2ADB32|nr:succinylglutamate desuccinylase [Undibacterium sp.]HTD05208.1 succinylglutamate desuccinylase [Undibacterium sp.]
MTIQKMTTSLDDKVRALAEGNFTTAAESFAKAGFAVVLPAPGILQIKSPQKAPARPKVLLSVGVHGDETAPIELLAQILAAIAIAPHELATDLMVVVGNPAAIAKGRRFIDVDMNRLFSSERGEVQSSSEAQRADAIMSAVEAFFADSAGAKWHLDLHTTIRPSHYSTFAIIPNTIADTGTPILLGLLGNAGIAAAILNSAPSKTFSAYTARRFGAISCTVELGQVSKLGHNDLSAFAKMEAALKGLLTPTRMALRESPPPQIFQVSQEIVKHSENFRLMLQNSTYNFTEVQPGAAIAVDGDIEYRVGQEIEYIVFPNPDVRVKQRAGLMVVRYA